MKQPVSDFQQCRSAIAQHGQNIEAFIKTVLADIKTANAELGLFEYIDEATVLSDAARLDALPQEQREALPLAGLPFAVKDIIDVAGARQIGFDVYAIGKVENPEAGWEVR